MNSENPVTEGQPLLRDDSEPVIPCYGCGGYYEESSMVAIDVSRDDEYYPRFIHVCHGCNRRQQDTGGDR